MEDWKWKRRLEVEAKTESGSKDHTITEMENLSVEEVCRLLESKGFEPDIIDVLWKQKVAGCVLVDMDDAEMMEIGIEAWGDRRRLRKLISSGCVSQPEKTGLTAKRSIPPRTCEMVCSITRKMQV